MENDRFDLVYEGDLVPGFELAQVKKNLMQLFRIDESKVDVLFSGKPVTLKKNLDFNVANKYRVAMKKAGARVNLVPSPKAETAIPDARRATPSESAAPERREAGELSTELGARAGEPPSAPSEFAAPDYSVAAAGSELLTDAERPEREAVEVDVSALSVTEQRGNLVADDEIARAPAVEVDIPEVDVLPAGGDVLRPDERNPWTAAEVDTSAYSLAQPGERLAPEKGRRRLRPTPITFVWRTTTERPFGVPSVAWG